MDALSGPSSMILTDSAEPTSKRFSRWYLFGTASWHTIQLWSQIKYAHVDVPGIPVLRIVVEQDQPVTNLAL